MARYIDADELKKQVDLVQVLVMGGRCQSKTLLNETMEIYKKGIFKKIDEQPTADVASKSEVDEIIGAFDTWLYKHYNGDISDLDLYKLFAELKKKYAEGESNGNITEP